ncbi:MAG: hypothetical protein ACYTE8_00370 [Planctomycetota bacterium]|jgi:hypothetical protein
MARERVFKEELYRSKPAVNTSYDMVRITINLPLMEWRRYKQRFIELLHIIRIGG